MSIAESTVLDRYRRAEDQFDAVMAAVPSVSWDGPSACTEWTLRDVAGHVIWAQHQVRHWATGSTYAGPVGGPGSPHPRALAESDPLAIWRAARTAAELVLDDTVLEQPVPIPGLDDPPLSAMIELLVTDHLAHAWDIASGAGLDLRLPDDLVAASLEWARGRVTRAPGFIGPELAAPHQADVQTRWLAYLGRAAFRPVVPPPSTPTGSE